MQLCTIKTLTIKGVRRLANLVQHGNDVICSPSLISPLLRVSGATPPPGEPEIFNNFSKNIADVNYKFNGYSENAANLYLLQQFVRK